VVCHPRAVADCHPIGCRVAAAPELPGGNRYA